MSPSQMIIAAYEDGKITWEQIADAFEENPADWDGFDEYREYLTDSMVTQIACRHLRIDGYTGPDAVTAAHDQARRIMGAQTINGRPGRCY